jgi:DNA/RNA-binding domain of Phe-tRNA-synthetase-like protein
MHLDVASGLLDAGLGAAAVVVRGLLSPPVSRELLAYRKRTAERLAAHLKNRSVASHPAVVEYRAAYGALGLADLPSMPEKVLAHVRRNRDVASSGALGDCASLVAARTLVGVAVRDLAHLPGGVSFTKADETLGLAPSDVTPATRDVVFLLHANRVVGPVGLLEAAWLLVEMVERFCGARGEVRGEIAGFAWPGAGGAAPEVDVPLPTVGIQAFQRLSLLKGTVSSVRPLAGLPELSIVTLAAGEPVEALAPTAALPAGLAGRAAVAATGLHPLALDGQRYAACLLFTRTPGGRRAVQVDAPIPDGKRLV